MNLKKVLDGAREAGRVAVLAAAQSKLPGLTKRSLSQGWIPVPEEVIQAGLRQALRDVEAIEDLSLRCRPGSFVISADTSFAWMIKNRLHLRVAIVELTLSGTRQFARLSFDDDVPVEGRGFLGRLSVGLVESTINAVVRDKARNRGISQSSQGVIRLDWPQVDVLLSEIPQVRGLAETTILGSGVFEILEIGPATIEEGHVRLKLSLPGKSHPELPTPA